MTEAESCGVQAILVTGSTFSPSVDVARKYLRTDPDAHDEIVVREALSLAPSVDVIILAQSSLYSAMKKIKPLCSVPVYASPELAVEFLRRTLEGLGWKPEK